MKLLLSALCMTAVIGTTCFAEQKAPAFPSWVYPCPKTTSPPTIDGKNDDAAYRNAPVAGGFIDYHRPTQYIKPTTTFQVVHDGKTLYFAFHCEEPEIAELKLQAPKGRDAIASVGETVEVFIDVNHDHDDYYQWIVGLNRDLYDAFLSSRPQRDATQRSHTVKPLTGWEVRG